VKIDIEKFLFLYQQQEFKTINDHQRAGLADLLGYFSKDAAMNDLRWIAYCLATTLHETAGTWLPIAEYGRGKDKPYSKPAENGKVFYGRGYVQLTWADNYKTMCDVCGVDLFNNPDLAMQPEIAYRIMSYGMRRGSFTGVGLKRYINDEKCDYLHARKIINGMDKAELIAGYAEKFEDILKATT